MIGTLEIRLMADYPSRQARNIRLKKGKRQVNPEYVATWGMHSGADQCFHRRIGRKILERCQSGFISSAPLTRGFFVTENSRSRKSAPGYQLRFTKSE